MSIVQLSIALYAELHSHCEMSIYVGWSVFLYVSSYFLLLFVKLVNYKPSNLKNLLGSFLYVMYYRIAISPTLLYKTLYIQLTPANPDTEGTR